MVADAFIQRYIDSDITHIACIDARGFLFGSILAHQLNLPLVLVRKKGKLPARPSIRTTAWSTVRQQWRCSVMP